jgi:heme exporter protein D
MNGTDLFTDVINPALWLVSNLQLGYLSLALVAWVLLYGFGFRWWTTPAGQMIFAFTASLLGVIVLVFVGVFVNPQRPWFEAPPDVFLWRPLLRYLVYLAVSITLTRMVWSLVQRLRGRQPILFDIVPRESRTGPTATARD